MNKKNHILPNTVDRVPEHTSAKVNRRIQRQTEANIAYFVDHPDEIDARLEELDREWDIERVLEANAATLALSGTVLGAAVDRRFLFLPALVTGFLLQHAVQGWCPPVSILRRLGVRTAGEIDRERDALRFLRGDFREKVPKNGTARERARRVLSAVEA